MDLVVGSWCIIVDDDEGGGGCRRVALLAWLQIDSRTVQKMSEDRSIHSCLNHAGGPAVCATYGSCWRIQKMGKAGKLVLYCEDDLPVPPKRFADAQFRSIIKSIGHPPTPRNFPRTGSNSGFG